MKEWQVRRISPLSNPPFLVLGWRSPKTSSNLLGHILRRWRTQIWPSTFQLSHQVVAWGLMGAMLSGPAALWLPKCAIAHLIFSLVIQSTTIGAYWKLPKNSFPFPGSRTETLPRKWTFIRYLMVPSGLPMGAWVYVCLLLSARERETDISWSGMYSLQSFWTIDSFMPFVMLTSGMALWHDSAILVGQCRCDPLMRPSGKSTTHTLPAVRSGGPYGP